MEQVIEVFGSLDENIRKIEDAFHVHVVNRGEELKIQGEEENADRGVRAIEGLLALAAKGETIDEQKVRYLIDLVKSGNDDKIGHMAQDVVCVTAKGKPSRPRPWASSAISGPSRSTPSPWAWAPPVPARPIWPWQRP